MKELENKRIENRKFARKRAKMLMAQEGIKNPCSPVKVASRNPITGAQTYKNYGSYMSANWRSYNEDFESKYKKKPEQIKY